MKNNDRPLVYVYFPPRYAFLFDAQKGEGVYEVGCIAPLGGMEGQSGGFSALFKNHVSTNVVFTTVLTYDATAEARMHRVAAFQERLQYELLRHGVKSRNDLGQGHVQGSLSSITYALFRTIFWCQLNDDVATSLSSCYQNKNEGEKEKDDVCMEDNHSDENKRDMDISCDVDAKLRLR